MDNSKLSQRMRMLTPREFKQFTSFVHSPFFSTHEETIHLFDLLAPHFPDFGLPNEAVVSAWQLENPPALPRVRVLRSYLLQLLEQYLVQVQLQAEPSFQAEFLARQYIDRGFYQDAERKIAHHQAQLELGDDLNLPGINVHLRLMMVALDLRLRRQNQDPNLGIDQLLHTLDYFHLATRLQYLCTYVSLGFHRTVQVPFESIEKTLEAAAHPILASRPLVGVYRHLLKLLLEAPHTNHYPTLVQELRQHGQNMGKDDLVNIFGFLQNHLNKRYQSGESTALAELLQLYGTMLDLDAIFGRGSVSTHLFRNIAVVGARLGENTWTQKFITDHAHRLDEDQREVVRHYSLAYLCFTKGEYGMALQHLLQVDFIDPFYRTGHQILLLRIYFETGETEPFHSLTQTFRRFLNRNRSIAEAHREASLNFISIARRLIAAQNLRGKPRKVASERIRQEIDKCTYLTDSTWLKAKWEGLLE